MRNADEILKDIKKAYNELEKVNQEYAGKFIIGKAFGYDGTGQYHFAFETDGGNVQVITISEYSASMSIEDVPFKSDIFKQPIDLKVFTEAKKKFNDKLDKIIKEDYTNEQE